MRVLAIDTSTELGTVACLIDGRLRAEVGARVRARHGETVFKLIGQVLEHAGIERDDLDLIACGIGPGSFTGTRVGVASAKGLALALNKPIVGVSTLRVLARGAPGTQLAPAVDAHKGEVYAAVYERVGARLEERVPPMNAAPDVVAERLREFDALTVFGSGARKYATVLAPSLSAVHDAPRAAVLGIEALEKFESEGPDDLASLEPQYVRPSDAELPQR